MSMLPEWYPQKGILMAWPAPHTDWGSLLTEAENCYLNIITEISKHTVVYLLCENSISTREKLKNIPPDKVNFITAPYNDTWARDFGPIGVKSENNKVSYVDFGFNGWGAKFKADRDNLVNKVLLDKEIIDSLSDQNQFILEGGSLETDGAGTLLSTVHCLMAPNRNQPMNLPQIEAHLTKTLGLDHFLWLNSGYLAGDDTDSHIDTLARFCSPDTIAYVSIEDINDEHYTSLKKMEKELLLFKSKEGKPFHLIPLPMAEAVYDENENRLPATYANFLIMDKLVLVPTYGTERDSVAIKQVQLAFPGKIVEGIDCSTLIKQHGSLHCITMQLPKN